MKRLLSYLKPHIGVMITTSILVLLIIVVELYRPIIIGDAIDQYISAPNEVIGEIDVIRRHNFMGVLRAAAIYGLTAFWVCPKRVKYLVITKNGAADYFPYEGGGIYPYP